MKELFVATALLLASSQSFAVDLNNCNFQNDKEASEDLKFLVNATIGGSFDDKFIHAVAKESDSCGEAKMIISILADGLKAKLNIKK